jgi:hypothetical protein
VSVGALDYSLVNRETWGLVCNGCRRDVVVDPIGLVKRASDVWTFEARATFAYAKCRECGGRMKIFRGYQVGGLQFTGWMPLASAKLGRGGVSNAGRDTRDDDGPHASLPGRSNEKSSLSMFPALQKLMCPRNP